jgi:hypothetical protein
VGGGNILRWTWEQVMSRKANNLRKRLRVEQDRARVELAKLREYRDAVAMVRADCLREQANLRKQAALTIRLDDCPQHGDLMQLTVTFRPEMFRFCAITRSGSDPFNISHYAHMQGREVGEKVARAIVDHWEKRAAV